MSAENGLKVMKGLSGVRVLIENFRRSAEEAGFAQKTFQTDVELKLRLARIKVLADDDYDEDWSSSLYLNVNSLHTKPSGMAAYSIQLELLQPAVLWHLLHGDLGEISSEDLSRLTTRACTWSRGALGYGDLSNVRDAAKDVVDLFVNDWLAVNG